MSPIVETIIMVAVALGLVGVGMILVPYSKKRGWLKDSNIKTTEQMLMLLKAITNKNLNGENKERILMIYDSIIEALKFVQKIASIVDPKEKKELIYNRTVYELIKYGIVVDEDDQIIIEILIDNCVDLIVDD